MSAGMAGKEVAMSAKRLAVNANRPPPANHLLAALPPDVFDRIAPTLDVVPLKLRQFLHKAGEPIRDVYFPGGGFISLVTVLNDGGMIEVATVGREGVLGVSAVLNDDPSPSAALVQAETNTCYRMPADVFREEIARGDAFHELMARYAQALVGFIMQATACNAAHSVEQRLARWLLMAHDRVGKNEFPLTQEFVAVMLGVSRPTVTVVAGTLQKAGSITYHRGHLTIVDREKLEAASCECYATTTALLKNVTRADPASWQGERKILKYSESRSRASGSASAALNSSRSL
jgi:CRP-like cAMP-binding protein